MGHQRIGKLPATRQWNAVIELIAGGADVSAVAAASADAAESSLAAYANDSTVRRAFFLLTQIPLAARQDDFAGALRKLGLEVERPDLIQISAAFLKSIDDRVARGRSDLGEMVSLSAAESLQSVAGHALDDLFGADANSPDRTKEVLGGLATVKQFGTLAEDFFARLLRRHLGYYLSRELPRHVGLSKRFPSCREHDEFEQAFTGHCRETARITFRFAGEWFSKTTFEGGIDEKKAGGFVFVALDKLRRELHQRRGSHA